MWQQQIIIYKIWLIVYKHSDTTNDSWQHNKKVYNAKQLVFILTKFLLSHNLFSLSSQGQ